MAWPTERGERVQEMMSLPSERSRSSDAAFLDLDHLSRQTFGDAELERDILSLFRDQCRKLAPVIVGNSQLPTRIDAAHTLKGGARAVGAVEVARVTEEIEMALRHHGELARGQGDVLFDCVLATGEAIEMRLLSLA